MVKLRVAARILSEDDYLKNLQGTSTLPVKGEKRLVVVVRDPYKWQIGTLALEVQRAYQSCYQHELPTIKYLKDNEDDCDLDPQAYVSDLLLDEGKAQIDASDQRVTIKVILEKGRALREGSVAIGSQLDDPQYRNQLEKTSRPPVPTFPSLPSSLGKRPFSTDDDYVSTATARKRSRQVEIPETQREDQTPISSVEHEDVQGSLELVEGTQFTNPDQDLVRQQTLLKLKEESPELRRSLQNVAPATIDELEELAERPPTFRSNKRLKNGSAYPQDSRKSHPSNSLLSSTDSLGPLQKRSQGPITPPSETSRKLSTSADLQFRRSEAATNSTVQSASASVGKFKRRDIYDYPESDIDDSQMSPRSRQAQLSSRKSKDRLSHIERLQSPQEHVEGDNALSISQAIDALDDESVFEDSRSIVQPLPAPEPILGKTNTGETDEVENSIYEDAEMGYAQHPGLIDTTMPKEVQGRGWAESEQLNDEVKENRPPDATFTTRNHGNAKDIASEDAASGTQNNVHDAKSTDLTKDDHALEARPILKRVRKRKSDSFSVNTTQQDHVQKPGHSIEAVANQQAKKAPKPGKKAKEVLRTPTLDSPGEQLSQNLQESTENHLRMDTLNKRLIGTQKETTFITPAKKNKSNLPGKDSEGPSSAMSHSTASKKNASLTTPTERIRNKKSHEKPAVATKGPEMHGASSSPNIVLRASQQDGENTNALTKPLPNWGSEPAAADKRGSSDTLKAAGICASNQADSGKSTSFGLGLTPEEIRTMESRKGMTKEQYEAEKKRKQLEAKRKAEGQRKQGAAAKKKPTTEKPAVDKTLGPQDSNTPELKPAITLTKTKAPKSISVEDDSPIPADKSTRSDATTDTGEPKQGTKPSSTRKANSTRRESSSASFSKDQITESKVAPKTPAKAPTKSPSVKLSTVSKTPKHIVQQQSAEKTASSVARKSTPAPIAKTELKAGKTPAKTPQPRKPTLETAKRLVDLHEVVRSASKAAKATTDSLLSRVNAAKQTQKASIFNLDDDDDDEESDDSEEDDEEEVKVVPVTRKMGQQEGKKKSNGRDNGNDSGDDSSSPSSLSSEEEDGKKNNENAITRNEANATTGKLFGRSRPGPSNRDQSTESDDDDDDDSDSDSDSDS